MLKNIRFQESILNQMKQMRMEKKRFINQVGPMERGGEKTDYLHQRI
jgi:hypothetical protein